MAIKAIKQDYEQKWFSAIIIVLKDYTRNVVGFSKLLEKMPVIYSFPMASASGKGPPSYDNNNLDPLSARWLATLPRNQF